MPLLVGGFFRCCYRVSRSPPAAVAVGTLLDTDAGVVVSVAIEAIFSLMLPAQAQRHTTLTPVCRGRLACTPPCCMCVSVFPTAAAAAVHRYYPFSVVAVVVAVVVGGGGGANVTLFAAAGSLSILLPPPPSLFQLLHALLIFCLRL